jgi:cellulose synthase/poly-beta-1,6-N-acetylglucosamine synthase-like glycosyltransferase
MKNVKKKLVSIIIPTLNEEKCIESTLKAIKNQDYKGKYEIIVADGMSKDNTIKIAKKYTDKIVLVEKKGAGAGRNAGAKIARGEILLFIDADTIILFNTLSEIVKPFKKKKVIGATCPIVPLSPKARDFVLYWLFNQFVKTSIKSKIPQIAGICCAYRKSSFEEIGGFDESLKVFEDIDLSKRISKLGEIVFVEKTFVITSMRRIEAWGRTKAARKYITFYLNYILTGKSIGVDKYRPIRKFKF